MIDRTRGWYVVGALGAALLLLLVVLARPAAAAGVGQFAPSGSTGTHSAAAPGQSATRPQVGLTTTLVYLPVILKPLPGIQGHVTYNGLPESGAFLELRFYDGQSYSTAVSTFTDGSGFYNLTGAPSLAPGQSYYVRYLNTGGTAGRLWFWGTADITSYSAGSALAAGDFDLGDVSLLTPDPGATVALPALFQWVARPATPSDSYQLTLFDPQGDAFGQTNLLGYVSGINLTGVPSDFHNGTEYGWEVNINSPDGGYGTSYYYSPIYFSNVLADGALGVEGGAVAVPGTARVDRPRP